MSAIDDYVSRAQAGDQWQPIGLPEHSDLDEVLLRLGNERHLAPEELPDRPNTYLMPSETVIRQMCQAARSGDMYAAALLLDYLADRGIPRPPRLTEMVQIWLAGAGRDSLYHRVRHVCLMAACRPGLLGDEDARAVVREYLPDLDSAGYRLSHLRSVLRVYSSPQDWDEQGSDLAAMLAAVEQRRARGRSARRRRGQVTSLLLVMDIRTDGGTQQRVATDEQTVADYANHVAALPPVVVYHDGTDYWLADGHYRLAAHVRAGRHSIRAQIRSGTRRDAVLYSCIANTTHGRRRSADDSRQAVRTLLADPEWSQWSGREIARRCDVSEALVRTVREELSARRAQIGGPDTGIRTVQRGGTTYPMRTAAIGIQPKVAAPRAESVLEEIIAAHAPPERPEPVATTTLGVVLGLLPRLTATERGRVRQRLDEIAEP